MEVEWYNYWDFGRIDYFYILCVDESKIVVFCFFVQNWENKVIVIFVFVVIWFWNKLCFYSVVIGYFLYFVLVMFI